jgi:branched-chain amino acid transport system permease protein
MADLPLGRCATAIGRRPRLMAPRLLVAALLVVGLALVPPIASALGDAFYVKLVIRIMIFAIAAASLNLILGYGGMVSFGHAAFVGIGAYAVGILSWHATNSEPLMLGPLAIPGTENALVAWPLAVVAAALVALVVGAISLRTSGVYFIMITLAFAQMLYFFFVALQKYGGDDGTSIGRAELPLVRLGDRTTFYYVVYAALMGCLFLSWRLVESRFGMVIRGCRQNERRLRAIGFPTYRYKLAAFVAAGAMAGLAGALFADVELYVSPAIMHWTRSGEIIVMVILGGRGTLFGPVLGAAVYLLLEQVIGGWTTHWQVIFGPILILVVLFAKGGLLGLFERRTGGHG